MVRRRAAHARNKNKKDRPMTPKESRQTFFLPKIDMEITAFIYFLSEEYSVYI
jgi:hypothetical protein